MENNALIDALPLWGLFIAKPLVLLRQNYYGRGAGVSFGCLGLPPSGCPCAWT
jgi:hypothetical protein